MRFPLLFILSLTLSFSLFAEGTREVAPNANIVISGNNTTDIAALLIDNDEYNNFATYDNPDPNSRLYIHIADPTTECVFLGFSFGHANENGSNPTRLAYEYRVRDPNGNVVFGPITVNTTGGNIQNWSEGNTGPVQIYGVGGYNALQVQSADLMSQGWTGAGDYFIEFQHATAADGLLIDFWDISVSNCAITPLVESKGRVWSYNWAFFAINDFNFPNRPFNGAFYVCAPDPDNIDAAFITKIDFNNAGFRPAAFNVAFNSFGSINTGDVMVDRRSVEGMNTTQAEYSVFLNDPLDLCETAEIGEIELLGATRCSSDDYCIKFIASREGQVDLLLDFDGPDDVYTPGTADFMIAINVEADDVGKPSCVSWNGQDGLGNSLPEDAATQIPVVISFAQGIYHFPIYDAEFMLSGVSIEAIRPSAAKPLLYYDDSNITEPSGSGEPSVQLSGCITPCHRWTNFPNAQIPGFGNLNTINSWWFSQRIVRSDFFFLPAYLSCGIEGPLRICENENATLSWNASALPAGTEVPEVISSTWTGPDIVGSHVGQTISIAGGGTYVVDIQWLTQLGDTCASSCEFAVIADPISASTIDTLIAKGETIEINGETFNEGGQYHQVLIAANGCDSILTINITVLQTIVHFSLDACLSIPTEGSDAVYTEFTPVYPEPLSCATLTAGFAHRDNPTVNTHSCTPGVNDSPAICVSSYDNCTYDAGNEKAFVFDVTVTPAPDTAVAVTGLSFYERGPVMFDWINGMSGPNNYPTLFGVRILKDDVEIYRSVDLPTTLNWTLSTFDFLDLDEFIVTETTTFRFELLGYCLIDNGEMKTAWDIDEIRVVASCVSPFTIDDIVSGKVSTELGQDISDVEIALANEPEFLQPVYSTTDAEGAYTFTEIPDGDTFYLRGTKNSDFLNGVSTLDLIKMQKHLLGVKEFDSPLQYIAADASGNAVVSALDVVHVRRLILGLYTEFPGNTSWRFGAPDQSLTLANPWDFKETIELPASAVANGDINFLAVKIGDVNGSVDGVSSEIVSRSQNTLHLQFADQQLQAGETSTIAIRAREFNEIMGLQCALQMEGGTIINVQNGALDMTDASAIHDGMLKISWNETQPLSLSPDEILFTIVVMSHQGGDLSESLEISDALHAEAYTGKETRLIGIDIGIAINTAVTENSLFQNVPNPFSSSTDIRFALAEPTEVTLSVYTLTGMQIWQHKEAFGKGEHTITLGDNELDVAQGVLIYQLRTDTFVDSNRMILLKR